MAAVEAGRARQRSAVRAVAVPAEHGGWGLTLEPALLGLLLEPSGAGLLLLLAALLAFVARTPLKAVLVERFRHRRTERTSVAVRVLMIEGALLAVLVAAVAASAAGRWWWPAVVAAPLVAVELWFDMRSRSRRLLPELAGAAGMGAVAAMAVIAGGGPTGLAVGAWCVVGARTFTAIPTVRAQVARLHGRTTGAAGRAAGDIAATGAAAAAVLLDGSLVLGALGVLAVVALHRLTGSAAPSSAKALGLRQMVLGLALVGVTAAGAHLS